MVSPDQAKQAADSLMEPAKRKLAAKQEKIERREATKARTFEALLPAAVAAGVALTSYIEFGSSIGIALFLGVAFGGIVGSAWRKGA